MTIDPMPTVSPDISPKPGERVPISPDHLTEADRRRSQIEQTATDIAAG